MNYEDLMISNQNFFMVLPFNGRFHFNLYSELQSFCKQNDLLIDDQDIRLGYDSELTLNTFQFFDTQDYIEPKLIAEVERNQHRKKIANIFNEIDDFCGV